MMFYKPKMVKDTHFSAGASLRQTAIKETRLENDNSYSNTDIAYTYDKLNRLTQESSISTHADLNFSNQYAYDLNGNRTQKVCATNGSSETINYNYNYNDQLTSEESSVKGITSYQYDANGSLISKVGGDESYAYTYNLRNRLASANIQRTEGGQVVNIASNYAYDQSGIRVKVDSTVNGISQNRTFLIDGMNFTGYAQILEESANAGDPLTKSYVIGDDILSQDTSEEVKYLLYDGHGSTRLLADATGSVTDQYSYDAYGVMLGGNPNATNPAATDMLYSGEQFDTGLQQQYLRARYYNQNSGRFNALDPFAGSQADPQSLHKYAYCHSDPINAIDPSGLFSIIELISVLFIVSVCINIAILNLAPNISKTGKPEYWFGLFSTVSAGAAGFKLNGGLLSMLGLSSHKLINFSLVWLSVSLKVAAVALGIATGFGLLMYMEMASSLFTSTTIPAASNFLLRTMDKGCDLIINELAQVNASFGTGVCLAWANKPGDLAGVSLGVEGGVGREVKGARAGIGIAGGISFGMDVHNKRDNEAWALSFGASVGVSAGIKPPSWGLDAIVAFALPNNMPDWTTDDL